MIKSALKQMLQDKEFEKIIKHSRGRDKQNAKLFYESIKDFEDEDFEKVPEIIFITACKSYNVWQDLYFYIKNILKSEEVIN